jgi:hypothetical protein
MLLAIVHHAVATVSILDNFACHLWAYVSFDYSWDVLTSCLPFTLRSATVRDSGYISEKVFSVASAVTCVSGELKSAGNILTGGQRVC